MPLRSPRFHRAGGALRKNEGLAAIDRLGPRALEILRKHWRANFRGKSSHGKKCRQATADPGQSGRDRSLTPRHARSTWAVACGIRCRPPTELTTSAALSCLRRLARPSRPGRGPGRADQRRRRGGSHPRRTQGASGPARRTGRPGVHRADSRASWASTSRAIKPIGRPRKGWGGTYCRLTAATPSPTPRPAQPRRGNDAAATARNRVGRCLRYRRG